MMRRVVSLALLALAGAAPAVADTGLSFDISNAISPNHPSTTIQVWAYFDKDPYAFAAVDFDVTATHDQGGFSDPFSILHTLGTFNGDVQPDGDSVTHCLPGQIQAPVGEWYAETTNPILVWSVTWSTSDFTPRIIDLSTFTYRYAIYLDYDGNSVLLDGTTEALGKIKVVPAPGVLAPFAAAGGVAFGVRRRRA